MPGYPVAPAPMPDWYDQLDPDKQGPKLSPYGPDEDTTIPDIRNLLKPTAPAKADVNNLSPTMKLLHQQQAPPRTQPSVPLPTEPPASGDDVKESAKQGIVEGMNAYAQSQNLAKGLKLEGPTADVKRSKEDIKSAVDVMSKLGGDEVDPLRKATAPYSKPGLEQETKTGDQARRLQQSATEQLNDIRQPSNEAMKRLSDDGSTFRKEDDDKLRQRLLQPPQLMTPSIDPQAFSTKVEGSATLKVDIAAPPGTKAVVDADGLFSQTEMKRRRAWQMEKTAFNDGFDS